MAPYKTGPEVHDIMNDSYSPRKGGIHQFNSIQLTHRGGGAFVCPGSLRSSLHCPIINPTVTLMKQYRKACYCLRCIYTHFLMKRDFLPSVCFVSWQRKWKGRPVAGWCRPDCARVVCLLCHVAAHCLLCSWWRGSA